MSRNRRKQQSTEKLMSTDTDPIVNDQTTAEPDTTDVHTEEEQPVVEPEKPASATPPLPSKGILRALLNQRSVNAVPDELWKEAVYAVRDGKVVTVISRPPYIEVTGHKFDRNAKTSGNSINGICSLHKF